MNPIAVFTTVATRDDALRLARLAVEQRLAACVQLSVIESVYTWDGRVQQESEVRVLFKTTDVLYDRLERAILAVHPYELPAIHALAFDRVHAPFARWIVDSTGGGAAVQNPAQEDPS
jgi:periplasmic divalent cation tolerance protein